MLLMMVVLLLVVVVITVMMVLKVVVMVFCRDAGGDVSNGVGDASGGLLVMTEVVGVMVECG